MVEQVVKPLNIFTNDIVNMFDYSINDIDVDIDVDINNITSMNLKSKLNNNIFKFTTIISSGIKNMIVYIEENKYNTLSNSEFISYVNKQLASKEIVSDKKLDKLRGLWDYA
jgi:hypothetical protein